MSLISLQKKMGSIKMLLSEDRNIFKLVNSLDEIYNQVLDAVGGIAKGNVQNNYSTQGEMISSHLGSLVKTIRLTSPRQVFKDVDLLESEIKDILSDREHSLIKYLTQELDQFANIYSEYMATQSPVKGWPLLVKTKELTTAINNAKTVAACIAEDLIIRDPSAPDDVLISFMISDITGPMDFSEKLKALTEIYDELCMLANVVGQPLKIGRIESGSLWAELLGNAKIISLMSDLLKGGAKYFSENFTQEGKIASIPKTVESFDALLNITGRLKERGVDVSETEQLLAKGVHTLANNMNTLLDRQAVIAIDGSEFSTRENPNKKLGHTKPKQISYSPERVEKNGDNS